MENQLAIIQSKVKAPKGQFNSFGKYHYRSAEDILEAVKQVINPMGFYISISDTIIVQGDRFYVQATATLSNGTETYTSTAFAREEESKKGMDGSQVTGASSSYARKYALNGLFALDDTKDSDATNTHGKDQQSKPKIDDAILKSSINATSTIESLNDYYKQISAAYELSQEQIKLFANRKSQLQ
jgi:Flp pilus assembly protein TadG